MARPAAATTPNPASNFTAALPVTWSGPLVVGLMGVLVDAVVVTGAVPGKLEVEIWLIVQGQSRRL